MPIVLNTDDLIASPQPASLWCMVLLMAIRDHSESVHYHPWRGDDGLYYVLNGLRHVLLPEEPDGRGDGLIASARSLFLGDRVGNSDTAAGSFVLDVQGDLFAWEAVVWSTGERSGVELYFVGRQG